jgi:CCR4-NOT transcription complex subunit 4
VGEDTSATSLNDKAQRKAAKKAVAAERISERLRAAQEKTAEKARLAAEKEKAQQEKALREKAEKQNGERDRLAREKATTAEKEKAAQLEREKATQVERERVAQLEKEKAAQVKRTSANRQPAKTVDPPAPKQTSVTPTAPEPSVQVPLLSKKPKKNKPAIKPIRVAKEDEAAPSEAPAVPAVPISDPELEAFLSSVPAPTTVNSTSTNSRAQSVDRGMPPGPRSLKQLFNEIELQNPAMNLSSHPFFDLLKINPAEKMPLEYGPLVHALSALSVGGGSFANNMPTGTIDNAVSSFQQLLETLTQTISDLLRLLPRTTWDDSSSFDGVLRDMLKGDDFLDDGEDGHAKDDEVAALTLALERRARWMEVQLSKLEELHRDINTAAVRAILSFNDNGWDRHALLPRVGSTLRRFDNIGMINDAQKGLRAMTADELEKKLAVAKEAAVFAELEVKEMMEKMQAYRPVVVEV